MRQGNDVGTQYRSGIYYADERQKRIAEMMLADYDQALRAAGHDPITTAVEPAGPFYYAEDYHQQYLHKNPGGYCGLAGTGVACEIPPAVARSAEAAGSG
jgi:peptide-methionine (S)-S-oxide reductase